jgi:DNA-binding response OmpR family regulator
VRDDRHRPGNRLSNRAVLRATAFQASFGSISSRDGAMVEVLVVDDEPLLRMALGDALDEAGLEVAQAASAEVALAAAEAEPPAVLVTDVNLGPGEMDGIALADEAKRRWPGVGVVFITGRPSNLDGRALGARDRFLPKPFPPDRLVRAVRGLIPGAPARAWAAD